MDTAPCTEIEDYKALENVLDGVSGSSYYKICRDLGILKGTCNQLKNDEDLSAFIIAENYLAQHPDHCWENIIHHLCEDFKDKRLAKEVAVSYHVPNYSELCKQVQ